MGRTKSGSEIIWDNFRQDYDRTISRLKNWNALESDGIPAELIKQIRK